jgi:hypothetical protein
MNTLTYLHFDIYLTEGGTETLTYLHFKIYLTGGGTETPKHMI